MKKSLPPAFSCHSLVNINFSTIRGQRILDKRNSEWWTDAKFGIFIHCGLYSVPAYAPVNEVEGFTKSMQTLLQPPFKRK